MSSLDQFAIILRQGSNKGQHRVILMISRLAYLGCVVSCPICNLKRVGQIMKCSCSVCVATNVPFNECQCTFTEWWAESKTLLTN